MESIFSTFTESLDDALQAVAANMTFQLGGQVGPFLALVIALTLAFYLLKMAVGRVFDIVGLVYFVWRSAAVFSMATGGLVWTGYAYPFLSQFGERIGLLVFSRFSSASWNRTDGFNALLADYYGNVIEASEQLRSQIDPGTVLSFAEFIGGVAGIVTVFFAMVMIAVAFAILSVTKIMLFLFLALSPLFIMWAYLGATKSIFEGWMQGLVRLIIIQVLVFAALGLFVSVSENLLDSSAIEIESLASAAERDRFLLSQMWQLTFISVLGTFMLFAVPTVSAAMAGGAISVGASTVAFASGTMIANARNAALGSARGGLIGAQALFTGGGAGGAVGQAGSARAAAAAAGRDTARERARRLVSRLKA